MKRNNTKNIRKKNKQNKRKTMKGGIKGSPLATAIKFVEESVLPPPVKHKTPPKPGNKNSPSKYHKRATSRSNKK